MSIGKRLRLAIDASNLKVKGFSELTEIPYRSLQQYLSEDRSPAADVLTKICAQTNIDINWLLTGQGSMYRDQLQAGAEDTRESRRAALLAIHDALDDDWQRGLLSVAQEKQRLNKMEQQLSGILKKLG